jgi:hypothetical protein
VAEPVPHRDRPSGRGPSAPPAPFWRSSSRLCGCSRQQALLDQRARTVEIEQHGVQEFGALDQAAFELGPFLAADQQRQRIELPRPRHAVGIAVDVVGDAVVAHQPARLLPAPVDALRAEFAQRISSKRPGRGR